MTDTFQLGTLGIEHDAMQLRPATPEERAAMQAREREEEERYLARQDRERAEDRDGGQRVAALDMALRYCADAPDADHVVSVAETFHRFLAGIPAPTPAQTSN